MDVDLSPNSGRFKDGHGLHYQRVFDSHFLSDLPHPISVCEILEYFVLFVKGVSYFVDRHLFGDGQLSIFESFGLEKEPHLIA